MRTLQESILDDESVAVGKADDLITHRLVFREFIKELISYKRNYLVQAKAQPRMKSDIYLEICVPSFTRDENPFPMTVDYIDSCRREYNRILEVLKKHMSTDYRRYVRIDSKNLLFEIRRDYLGTSLFDTPKTAVVVQLNYILPTTAVQHNGLNRIAIWFSADVISEAEIKEFIK